ncbi:MAG: hypothetical protein EOP06_00210 [Proteobacteria bacterium]|nr:MAG: hypothetical protein EOP06_00210 [Pseudomonadota bacterium]
MAALLTSVAVGVMSLMVASRIVDSDRFIQRSRVRAVMVQTETQLRAKALSPDSYVCGDGGVRTCILIPSRFSHLNFRTSQGEVKTSGLTFDSAVGKLSAKIEFAPSTSFGPSTTFQPQEVEIDVPVDILQSHSFQCPSASPIFAGYETSGTTKGKPICKSVSSITCPKGSYVASIDKQTLSPICMPAGGQMSCGTLSQFYDVFDWNGTSNMNQHCRPRLDPFTNLGFIPAATLDNGYTNQDADTPDPVSYPPGGSLMQTWVSPAPMPSCP